MVRFAPVFADQVRITAVPEVTKVKLVVNLAGKAMCESIKVLQALFLPVSSLRCFPREPLPVPPSHSGRGFHGLR